MIDITISAQGLNDIDRYLGRLGNQANAIMARAANSAMSNVSKNTKAEVSDRYHISSSEVGKTIHTEKASYTKPSARVISRGEHPNLAKFKVSPMRRYRMLKSGRRSPDVYKASVEKNSGMKQLDGSPKPFVATMKNGFTGVFQRKDESSRSTLKGVYGPAVPQMVKNKEIMDRITEQANQMMAKRMVHEIERILG